MSRAHNISSVFARSLLLASTAAIVSVSAAAQTSPQPPLPAITVDAPQQKRAAAARPSQRNVGLGAGARAAIPPHPSRRSGEGPALTVSLCATTLRDIQQTSAASPSFRPGLPNSTVANTIKDVLDYVLAYCAAQMG
jgi:iron complex outermembrane receptor protein